MGLVRHRGRKTIKKRMRAKLLAIKTELHRILRDPIAKTGAWIKRMLQLASELLRSLGQSHANPRLIRAGDDWMNARS
jgi:hypothetical protein